MLTIPSRTEARVAIEPGLLVAASLFLLAIFPCAAHAQAASPLPQTPSAPPAAAPAPNAQSAAAPAKDPKSASKPSSGDRRRAVNLFLDATRLFEKERFEEAMQDFEQAATLDPSNTNYALAAGVARSHLVTALVQSASKDRLLGNSASARASLARALELDPRNVPATERLHELGDDTLLGLSTPVYRQVASDIGSAPELVHSTEVHSFHMRADQRPIIQQVFKAYGLDATLDDSIRATQIRLDMDDASFAQAMRVIGLLTHSFYVPLDAHRVLVAADTTQNRQQFTRQELETVYLSGLIPAEMDEVGNLAKNVFQMQQATVDHSAGTITVRAPQDSLNAFNATMRVLLDGRNQVLLEVRLIQIAHTSDRNTGIQPPQSISAFNVYAEEQSLLSANQALVQQIVSSGLAAPGDTLAILGILLASGQISSSLFSNGIALFGGGLTQSALAPGPATVNLNLNSSDSRELDRLQLRLGDGEVGTMTLGESYPIVTSSFSSPSSNLPNIPGLTGAGASGALSSLLSSLSSSVPIVPQVQYQDLGMTLKATPRVMRNNDVALTLDLKIDALSGASLSGNPILDNRAYSGVVSLRQGEGVVVISDLDRQQSSAISGVPGLSEIPGLNDLTGVDLQKSFSTLVIVITPHVLRGTQAAGHTPMMRVDKAITAAR